MRSSRSTLGRGKSASIRELACNSVGRGYRSSQAQRKATERRRAASAASCELTDTVWELIVSKPR